MVGERGAKVPRFFISECTVNLQEFSKANRARCESPDGFGHLLGSWSTSDWFTATMGELGEAANVAKKLNRVRDGIPGNKETPEELRLKLGRELADTFIYLDLLAQSIGINLSEVVMDTFDAKSEDIGYQIRLCEICREKTQTVLVCVICGKAVGICCVNGDQCVDCSDHDFDSAETFSDSEIEEFCCADMSWVLQYLKDETRFDVQRIRRFSGWAVSSAKAERSIRVTKTELSLSNPTDNQPPI